MARFLCALFIVIGLISSPAVAKDDGGFGAARFSSQAPVALGGQPSANQFAINRDITSEKSPADIEPAAGEDEDLEPTDVEQSNHKIEPYIIKKDLEVR